MFKRIGPKGVAMGIAVTYLAYLLISVGLIFLVGRVLSRAGRLVLLDVLGGSDDAASGISRLNVVTFYLISLGFVALTMRSLGEPLPARQDIELLATKIGEVLLVLGAVYLVSIVVLIRLRRRLGMQAQGPSQGLWRPAPKRIGQ